MRDDLFEERELFLNKIKRYIKDLKNVTKGENIKEIYFPGEIEYQRFKESEKEGVNISESTKVELNVLSEKLGVKQAKL